MPMDSGNAPTGASAWDTWQGGGGNGSSGGEFGVTHGSTDPSGPPTMQPQMGGPSMPGGGGSSGGSSALGGVMGGLGKVVGGLLGGLFASGGFVGGQPKGMAAGGLNSDGTYGPDQTIEPDGDDSSASKNQAPQQADNTQGSQDLNNAMAMGYLLGAFHQQNYGGTPQTLQQAGQEFTQMLQSKGFAQGGQAATQSPQSNAGVSRDDTALAQEALMHSLGLNVANQDVRAPQTQQPQAAADQAPDQSAGLPTQMPSTNGSQGFANAVAPAMNNQQNTPMNRPRGFAGGGPDMSGPPAAGPPSQNQPPLSPGQMFQGDGSVKGPGGPTDDAIPAKLSNGEFVMSAAATQFFGVDKLNQMNEKGKQGFMQALHQVDQNQQAGPGGPPQGQPPQAGPAMPAPQGQGPVMPPQMLPPGAGSPTMRRGGYMGM